MAANPLLAAADRVAAAAGALPTSEIGTVLPRRPASTNRSITPGWSVFEAQQFEIPVDALKWPKSIRTYEDMRRDPQIQGLLTSVFLPIRHMEWYIDPTGTTGDIAIEIAQDLGLPLMDDDPDEDGPGIDFDEHLRLALLALAIGHEFFEESGVIDDTTGRYRLRKLAERPPRSLSRISVADTGELIEIWQNGALPPPIIPADRLLTYVWDREGGNWAGRPLLYGLYRSWFLKDRALRDNAVMIRRFLGLPVVETTDPNVGKDAHDKAAEMAALLTSGDGSGLSTPYGTRLRLLGVEGTLPDPLKTIVYLDSQMARAFMQMFAELGQNSHGGSRALGTTLIDHYALGVLAIAKWIRKSLMALVRRIVVRNYGPGVKVPQIGFRQDDREDMTSADLVSLIDAGVIVVDDELEATIRSRGNLPPRDAAEPGRPTPNPPAPAASARPVKPRAIKAATGDTPDFSHVDFAALQEAFETAVTHLKSAWAGVQVGQIDDLVAQIKAARTVSDLAAISATVTGSTLLHKTLTDVAQHGADAVVSEFAAQGHTLAEPDLTAANTRLSDAADATAELLAGALSQSAASKALQLAGAGVSFDDVGDQVGAYLTGLAGQTPAYELHGLVTKAQNTGRFAAMDGAPDGTTYYASELMDSNTCQPCADEDGAELESLEDAQATYPAGYALCEGGNLCRGTVVAIAADESTPTVQ